MMSLASTSPCRAFADKGGIALPTELPVRRRSTATFELELMALASLLPWCLSLLLACHYPAIAHSFWLMGRLG
jgi:hypothetical protein